MRWLRSPLCLCFHHFAFTTAATCTDCYGRCVAQIELSIASMSSICLWTASAASQSPNSSYRVALGWSRRIPRRSAARASAIDCSIWSDSSLVVFLVLLDCRVSKVAASLLLLPSVFSRLPSPFPSGTSLSASGSTSSGSSTTKSRPCWSAISCAKRTASSRGTLLKDISPWSESPGDVSPVFQASVYWSKEICVLKLIYLLLDVDFWLFPQPCLRVQQVHMRKRHPPFHLSNLFHASNIVLDLDEVQEHIYHICLTVLEQEPGQPQVVEHVLDGGLIVFTIDPIYKPWPLWWR